MQIRYIAKNRKDFLDLLLLADEDEGMVDRYLARGEMFVLEEEGMVKAECVVTQEGKGIYEIKNLAVRPDCQRKGYGKKLVEFLFSHYADAQTWFVGTGECPNTLGFYRQCGFSESHRVKDFFIENYSHPIYENGIRLTDMIYLVHHR